MASPRDNIICAAIMGAGIIIAFALPSPSAPTVTAPLERDRVTGDTGVGSPYSINGAMARLDCDGRFKFAATQAMYFGFGEPDHMYQARLKEAIQKVKRQKIDSSTPSYLLPCFGVPGPYYYLGMPGPYQP